MSGTKESKTTKMQSYATISINGLGCQETVQANEVRLYGIQNQLTCSGQTESIFMEGTGNRVCVKGPGSPKIEITGDINVIETEEKVSSKRIRISGTKNSATIGGNMTDLQIIGNGHRIKVQGKAEHIKLSGNDVQISVNGDVSSVTLSGSGHIITVTGNCFGMINFDEDDDVSTTAIPKEDAKVESEQPTGVLNGIGSSLRNGCSAVVNLIGGHGSGDECQCLESRISHKNRIKIQGNIGSLIIRNPHYRNKIECSGNIDTIEIGGDENRVCGACANIVDNGVGNFAGPTVKLDDPYVTPDKIGL